MSKLKKILLIEDDYVDILTVQRAFAKLEVKNPLQICGNGLEALDYLRENEFPALIILDLNMPKMNGLEFLEEIKSDPKLSLIPIVVLTTSQEQSDRLKSFENHVSGYMVKPVEFKEFVKIMDSIRNYWENSELAY